MGKLIIVCLIGALLFIAGCAEDCTEVENAAVKVLAEYNIMKGSKDSLQVNYDALKVDCDGRAECNGTKVINRTITMKDCMDVFPKTNASSCVTYINRISKLEGDLEKCWFNESHDNYRDLYHICKDNREEDLETYNESIEDTEDQLADCVSDLISCEE